VSRRARTRAMLVRTSHRVRGGGSIPVLADPSRTVHNWASIPSPQHRPLAWRDAEDDANHWNVRSIHSLLLQPEAWQATGYGATAVWSHRHPYIGAFQASVFIERQFSRIFPAHPRSLARCLSRARRHGASLLRLHHPATQRSRIGDPGFRRPAGFGFQKILCARNAKRFSEPSEKDAAWPWERGTLPPHHTQIVCWGPRDLASLRARVSRG
jgi:hypothetical protein